MFGGGGDQGDSGEESTHLKPSGEPISLGNPKKSPMATSGKTCSVGMKELAMEVGMVVVQGSGLNDKASQEMKLEGREDWAMEIYKGKATKVEEAEIEDGILELDLDEERQWRLQKYGTLLSTTQGRALTQEIYKGKATKVEEAEIEDGILKLDLEEERQWRLQKYVALLSTTQGRALTHKSSSRTCYKPRE
jgi:hypothetical protein